jgi:Acyl-CoA reductase (LuxC)
MTDSTFQARRARLEPLLEAARDIANPRSALGKRARERLLSSTGLSPQGLNFALERCLESRPSEAELKTLLASTAQSARAHVLLSANVFVAAHRAIAIALAAATDVRVRASRREPEMAELLLEGAALAFELDSELTPMSGDQLWAYGSDDTLRSIADKLPPGVVLHAHGSGFGIGVIAGRPSDAELERTLLRLAEDIALFDQRGCLSPRLLLVTGEPETAHEVARELAKALSALESRIPRGRLDAHEAAEITAYRDAAGYVGEIFAAGLGFVSASAALVMPPVGRNLHVLSTRDVLGTLSSQSSFITSCAIDTDSELSGALRHALPSARFCAFGEMQRPPFDGPVDRRQRRF